MKQAINLLVFSLLLLFTAGCQKETMSYEGEEGIYFAVQFGPEWGDPKVWAFQQESPVEFVNIAGGVDTIKLKVMTTGSIKDYNRSFSVAVVKDSTSAIEGLNYEPLLSEYTVKAGEVFTEIPVVLMRTENIQNDAKSILLQLIPNSHFTLSIPVWKRLPNMWTSLVKDGDFNAAQHKITISDFITRPVRWVGLVQGTGLEAGRWGAFTEKKYRLICDEFNLVYQDFASEAEMPTPKQANIQEYMARYLQNLYDKQTPILEEDGRLMWFLGVSWTSTVGVPWKP